MLIEIKVKTKRIIDEKPRKKTELYLTDNNFFTEAEYAVLQALNEEQTSHLVEEFEIQSLRISAIKEIATQYQGTTSFVATLKDIWHDDDGTEKSLRYKVLLWADDLTQANQRVQELSREGYDMLIEGIKQVDYEYLSGEDE